MTLFRSLNLAVALSLLSFPAVMKAQSVATTPVGYITVTIPANKTQAFSIPLDNVPDYQGSVASLSGSTLTVGGVNWTNTTFGPYTSKPYVLRFTSGSSKGRQFPVSSNSTNSLVLVLPSGTSDVSSVAAVNDRFELIALDTLASFFGTGSSTSVLANVDPDLADNVLVNTLSGWVTFYHDGIKWLAVGAASSKDNFALSSEAGILFIRRASSQLTVTLSGRVPVTNLVTDVTGVTTFLANRFPVDTKLSQFGLQNDSSWVKSSDPDVADNVMLFTSIGWVSYYHDGTNWIRVAGPSQDPVIAASSSVIVVHKTGQKLTLNQSLPYVF